MPFELAGAALEGLLTSHLVIIVAILLVHVEPKSTAVGVWAGDELL